MRSILTVTEPASDRRLVTLAQVKAELEVAGSGEDAYLETQIARASARAETYCNRIFAIQTVSELWRRDPFQWEEAMMELTLDRAPTVEITSVTTDDRALPEDEFELDAEPGLLFRLRSGQRADWFWFVVRQIVVVYSGGFETIPADVQAAVLGLIKLQRAARTRDPLVKSQSVPGVLDQSFWVGSIGSDGALPPDIAGMLDPYVRPAI